jgi:hypothetical protein
MQNGVRKQVDIEELANKDQPPFATIFASFNSGYSLIIPKLWNGAWRQLASWLFAAIIFVQLSGAVRAQNGEQRLAELSREFIDHIAPLVKKFCTECHARQDPEAALDLTVYQQLSHVRTAHPIWEAILSRVAAGEMPPPDAQPSLSADEKERLVGWITAFREFESERTAGDPGPVLARRLSNVEFDNCVRDLTGIDIRPTRTFPVDPANAAGFDNTGESLAMSPALLNKYLSAARNVAEHMVFTPDGLAFAPHPVVTDTDRDKYCVKRLVEFYQRQPTDIAEYLLAAWCYQQRDDQSVTLTDIADQQRLSAGYLQRIWDALQEHRTSPGPWETLMAHWQALPVQAYQHAVNHDEHQLAAVRQACGQIRDDLMRTRQQYESHFDNLEVDGIHKGSQPFVLWKNKQYAAHRRTADLSRLQIAEHDAHGRSQIEAACQSFCSIFPDAFYISERGRDYLDTPKEKQEKGRLLSAGFHSMMGYFRDDQPLMELILDEAGRQELDRLWRQLDFFTAAPQRQYQGFLWFERTDSRTMRDAEFDFARPEDKAALTEPLIARLSQVYLAKAERNQANATALSAIADYFRDINAQIRWVEQARLSAEQVQLDALIELAGRAHRRPLTLGESQDLREFYHSLRKEAALTHEEALQDTLVSILMSPNFCYRLDLISDSDQTRPLNDFELASRLSFFLWSSGPDEELLAHATAGDLKQTEVLLAQTRRMLADDRVRSLATEFLGNWLDFRRFEQHNSVDRTRFASFDEQLRSAMFEEPLRFFVDLIQHDRSVLELLYADRTFVNRTLAQHYGLLDLQFRGDEWLEVLDVSRVGRGGLLPMAVFMTKNAPGLRTSPVKRGYWVVRHLLGQRIPPPPPNVPEIPADEAQLGELTLRETLAKHREHASCAGCHDQIDSIGLVFENYGPIGELRSVDLGGRPVDTRAEFPDGSQRASVAELRNYISESREPDFLSNFQRKLLSYALTRSLQLSDEPLLESLQQATQAHAHRFHWLVETIVTSPQFLNKRGRNSDL